MKYVANVYLDFDGWAIVLSIWPFLAVFSLLPTVCKEVRMLSVSAWAGTNSTKYTWRWNPTVGRRSTFLHLFDWIVLDCIITKFVTSSELLHFSMKNWTLRYTAANKYKQMFTLHTKSHTCTFCIHYHFFIFLFSACTLCKD